MMGRLPLVMVAGIVLTAALPSVAQVGNPGSGATPMGSRGYEWQTEQRLAQEALAQLEAELARMSEEEWLQEALAWLAFDCSEQGQIAVDDSFRIADLVAGRKAKVSQIDDDPMSWEVVYPKKPPQEIELTLTDDNSTQVDCSFGTAINMNKGLLGVFLHEGTLFCSARAEEGASASSSNSSD